MKDIVALLLAVAAISAAPSSSYTVGISGDAQNATLGQFPFMASLQRLGDIDPDRHFHVCGGFIISPTTIVTSAACLLGTGNRKIIGAVAGLVEITQKTGIQEFGIDSFILHPDFDEAKVNKGIASLNDIALVKLNGTIEYNDHVKAAILPEQGSDVSIDVDVQFAGWGYYLDQTGWLVSTNILRTTTYQTIDYETCYNASKAIIQNFGIVTLDKDLTQCVGPMTDKNGLVNTGGDAGGPLLQDDVAIGVYSYNINYWSNNPTFKGKKGPAGVFTKLSSYVSWIKENVSDL